MRPKRRLYNLALALIAGAGVNMFLFMVVTFALGGDTWNGKREGERYYLEYRGRYTEVSRAAWTWSRLHGMSTFVTFSLGLAGGLYALWYEKREPAAA